jgi:2-polyprenyl-3-methyl-5-hydroxy-6-metoxy-1,4-benzoquinol methylase
MACRFIGRGKILDIGCGTGQLARFVEPFRYVGVDVDEESIAIARSSFPHHLFFTTTEFVSSYRGGPFDVIAGLAVIEHVDNPTEWLTWLRTLLAPTGRVVLTTPHPSVRRIHELGGYIRVFSRESAKEHHEFLGQYRMAKTADIAGFSIVCFRRFLLGASQLFVLESRK